MRLTAFLLPFALILSCGQADSTDDRSSQNTQEAATQAALNDEIQGHTAQAPHTSFTWTQILSEDEAPLPQTGFQTTPRLSSYGECDQFCRKSTGGSADLYNTQIHECSCTATPPTIINSASLQNCQYTCTKQCASSKPIFQWDGINACRCSCKAGLPKPKEKANP